MSMKEDFLATTGSFNRRKVTYTCDVFDDMVNKKKSSITALNIKNVNLAEGNFCDMLFEGSDEKIEKPGIHSLKNKLGDSF